jgi:two-component system nitrate/nitrite response regulator NarL
MSTKPITIVIADDHPIFRDGLKKLLESDTHFSVIGEAANGNEALQLTAVRRPDVLLLDLAMPHGGLEALKQIVEAELPTFVIVLTAAIEDDQMVEALQHGARGIVLKESATELLFKSIRCVMTGQYWVGREGIANVIDFVRRMSRRSEPESTPRLTPRELEIMTAIVSGLNNRQIAKMFNISQQTVKHHLSNVYQKLGVSNRLELAVRAIEQRLVPQQKTPR